MLTTIRRHTTNNTKIINTYVRNIKYSRWDKLGKILLDKTNVLCYRITFDHETANEHVCRDGQEAFRP